MSIQPQEGHIFIWVGFRKLEIWVSCLLQHWLEFAMTREGIAMGFGLLRTFSDEARPLRIVCRRFQAIYVAYSFSGVILHYHSVINVLLSTQELKDSGYPSHFTRDFFPRFLIIFSIVKIS